MPPRNRLAPLLLLAGSLYPAASIADSVFLKNGQSFEGVEAVVSGDTVRIDLAIGSMRLPMSKVDRVEEVDSTLGEYRARETRLQHTVEDAAGWLELARWARANDFEQGAQKAALLAARLDPELAGLEPVMSSLGYLLDDEAREWLPYAHAMRRQGLVEDGDDWVTPEEKRERSGVRNDRMASEGSSSSRADEHLDKALDILAAAVAKPDPPAATVVVQAGNGYYPGMVGGYLGGGFIGGGFVGGGFVDPGIGDGPVFPGAFSAVSNAWDELARRQPASFIPMRSGVSRQIQPISHHRSR